MKITHVEYSRLVTGDNYSNEKIGAVAEVGQDVPAIALDSLKTWVESQFADREETRRLQYSAARLQDRIRELEGKAREAEGQLNMAREKWGQANRFLLKHGVTPDEEGLPF